MVARSFQKQWLCAAVTFLFAGMTVAQDFITAIAQFPELSNFTTLMYNNPGLAGALLTSNATSLTSITVLVPDNSAFDKLQVLLGVPVGSMTVEELEPILSYHVLVDELTTDNFTVANGTTVPTFLTGELYNNRSAGAALGSDGAQGSPENGQVVFIQAKDEEDASAARFTVRQLTRPGEVEVQGGLGHKINMTAVDQYFDGGVFQIVDNFLDLPLNCTDTIRRWKMFGFRSSLDRTGLGAPLDTTQNVTCFTPNDDAFLQAGSPNVTASIFDLQDLVLLHTITEPLYTNFLADGQEYTSFSNQTIRITVRDGQLFANDAKITHPNVITNNGVMHVIDKVMSPLSADTESSTTRSPSPTTSTSTSQATEATTTSATATQDSASPTGAASGLNVMSTNSWWFGLLALAVGAVV